MVAIFLQLNFSVRTDSRTPIRMKRHCSLLFFVGFVPLTYAFKLFHCAHTVDCKKSMPLKEEFQFQYLDGEALFWMKLSQIGSHEKVLIILWEHT